MANDTYQPRQVVITDNDTGTTLVTLDASVSETHVGEVEVTEHPVEVGAAITDHLRPRPRQLTIEGIVSNTPVGPVPGNQYPRGRPGPAEDARSMFEERRLAGKLHGVSTKLNEYANMALLSYSMPRTARIGEALRVTLTFREIIVVTNQIQTVKTATAQGQPGVDKGTRQPTTAPATQSDATVLKSILNSAGITTPGSGR